MVIRPGPRGVSRALIVRVLLLVKRAQTRRWPVPPPVIKSLFDGTHPQSKLFKESSRPDSRRFTSAECKVTVRLGHLFTGCTVLLSRGDAAAYQRAAELLRDLQKELKSVNPIVQDLLSVATTCYLLERLRENPTLNSIFERLSAELSIEKHVLHDFISAAHFQRELLELLTAGNPTRVEHNAYVSRAMECLSKIMQLTTWPIFGNPTLISNEAETGAAAELLSKIGPSPELAAYVKLRKNGKFETCCTGLINQYAARDAVVDGPMTSLGNGAARNIFAAVLDFFPSNDAAGAFKKGGGSQQSYTPPTALLACALADHSIKVVMRAVDDCFVVICVEGRHETELLLQLSHLVLHLDACSTSAAFAHPCDADPYLNGVNGLYVVRLKKTGPLALVVSSPSSGANLFGPFRSIDEKALTLNHFLARTNFLRELSGLAALPESQSTLVAY
ncbi:hypothetical protein T492DRAFT_895493, partial [Pavlovales sp. CCMP2436]